MLWYADIGGSLRFSFTAPFCYNGADSRYLKLHEIWDILPLESRA